MNEADLNEIQVDFRPSRKWPFLSIQTHAPCILSKFHKSKLTHLLSWSSHFSKTIRWPLHRKRLPASNFDRLELWNAKNRFESIGDSTFSTIFDSVSLCSGLMLFHIENLFRFIYCECYVQFQTKCFFVPFNNNIQYNQNGIKYHR